MKKNQEKDKNIKPLYEKPSIEIYTEKELNKYLGEAWGQTFTFGQHGEFT